MSPHSDTLQYPGSEPTSLYSFSLMLRIRTYLAEATDTNFIVFDLTRLELEPMSYGTRVEYH